MSLTFTQPAKTNEQLLTLAASGLRGALQARAEIKRRKLQQLREELGS